MPTFVLNDENKVNSYGFRVLNAGIDLTRFKANPVLLDEHSNSTSGVLGRWTNIRPENGQLLADDEFDAEDPAAKVIQGKVQRGYIRGCSIGFAFNSDDMEGNGDGTFTLKKCELYEASIVAIPSNANAVKLYAAPGMPMDAAQIRHTLSAIQQSNTSASLSLNNPIQQSNMKNLSLSLIALTALGFSEHLKEGDEGRLSHAIEKLAADLKAEHTAHAALKLQHDTLRKSQSKNVIDAAILSGKITAADRPEYEELGAASHDLLVKTLERMKGAATLSGQVNNPAGAGVVKTMDEFEKLSVQEQLSFKAANPDAYKKLFA